MNTKMDVETMETASSSNTNTVSEKNRKGTLKLSLFENITLKDVDIDIIPKSKIIPCRKHSRC